MNFKKCTSIIMAFYLLISSSGLAFNVHYCEGEIAAVTSVFNVEEVCEMKAAPSEKECCTEEGKDHKDCCKDKVVDLQDDSSDVIIKTFSFQIDSPFVRMDWKPPVFNQVKVSKKNQAIAYYCDANAPPLFKLYNQYIFYA